MTTYTFSQKSLPAIPPLKGSFPLDHDGQCKKIMIKYMRCLYGNENNNTKCRTTAKEYLECRMKNNLMMREDWSDLGFYEETEQQST